MAQVANGAGRRITTHAAQVKTAAVEVRVLTINGKQVTQSVFWQLENENLIDWHTAELRGVPWGRVNYYRAPCKDDHLHVVWQKGTELRRACVYAPEKNVAESGGDYWRADSPPWSAQERARELLLDWVQWAIAERDERLLRMWRPDYYASTYPSASQIIELRAQGEHLAVRVPNDAYALYRMRYEDQAPYAPNADAVWHKHGGEGPSYAATALHGPGYINELYRADLVQEEEDRVAAFRDQYGSRPDLGRQLTSVLATMHAHRQRYKDTYQALCALDQLFIAV